MTGLSFTAVQVLYLLCASAITIGTETLVIHWLGRHSWGKAVQYAALGLVPFVIVIAGFFGFLATPFYESQIAWTMTFGLPLLIFFGLLWLAWVAKTILQSLLSGTASGLVCGLIVFPVLWGVVLGAKGILWNALDKFREPTTLEDGVERGNLAYLKRELTPGNRDEIFLYALRHADAGAVSLALDAGANPNEPVGFGSSSPRTPLLWVIDSSADASERLEVLKLLLKRGADPNEPSPLPVYYSSSPAVGKTELPLAAAKKSKDPKLEKALLAAGAR